MMSYDWSYPIAGDGHMDDGMSLAQCPGCMLLTRARQQNSFIHSDLMSKHDIMPGDYCRDY